MNPRELDELATEIERCGPDETWLLPIPYGLSPSDRAASLDSISLVCAELRRASGTRPKSSPAALTWVRRTQSRSDDHSAAHRPRSGRTARREQRDRAAVASRAVSFPAIQLPSGAIRFREDALDAWIVERATLGRGVVTHPDERHPAAIVESCHAP